MKNFLLFCCVPSLLILNSCASTPAVPLALYDFGALPAVVATVPLPPLALADPVGSTTLDTPQMFYRLDYANAQQAQPYSGSRWSMAPTQLLGQRFKARFAQGGIGVIAAADGATNVPLLRIEIDEFAQVFDRPNHSSARLALRVAILKNRLLIGQKSFSRQLPAPSADAAGGARALADVSDALISDVIGWLATQSLGQR